MVYKLGCKAAMKVKDDEKGNPHHFGPLFGNTDRDANDKTDRKIPFVS